MDIKDENSIKDSGTQGGDEPFLQYVFLKKEKLTSALYLVTSFIPDQEPIKWKLREKGLELLSDINLAGDASGFYRGAVLEKVSRAIREISSLLDIAVVGGFISEMNAGVLKKEYRSFSEAIHNRLGSQPLETLLAAPVPELPLITPKITENAEITQLVAPKVVSTPIELPRPKITLRHSVDGDNLPIHRPAPAVTLKDNKIINPYKTNNILVPKNRPPITNNRQELILNFIRGRGWTPISDIAGAVPGVSVKTVQRELAELVVSGVLKKTGERRWSRYLLA